MTKNNKLQDGDSGFTILEILVIVVIVFVLAAVIFPRYVDYENKTRLAAVRDNMIVVQMAASAYANNNNGDFPLQADDPGFKSYFPGGNCDRQNPKGGNYPENPFTHVAETPVPGNVADVQQARQSLPADLGGSRMAGKIFYNVIVPPEQDKAIGYAIEGADGSGKALAVPQSNMTYVLSNL